MQYLHTLSPEDLAARARLAYSNTLESPEMMAAIAEYNYDADTFTTLLARVQGFQTLINTQVNLIGQQIQATKELEAARKAFHKEVYMDHATRARRVFRGEPGTLRRLGLAGRRAEAFDPWAGQVRQLYRTALDDAALLARLDGRGLTEAKLTAGLSQLDALVKRNEQQEDLKGQAQQATRDRDARRPDILKDLAEYYDMAEPAFRDHPDWLERIGKRAPSA